MCGKIRNLFFHVLVLLFIILIARFQAFSNQWINLVILLPEEMPWWNQVLTGLFQGFGHLLLTAVAIILAYHHFRKESAAGEKAREYHKEQIEQERILHDKQLDKEQLLHEKQLKFEQDKFNELLKFEKTKFDEESKARAAIRDFRESELDRYLDTAADIAEHVADNLAKDPNWAYRALESAKLLPYKNTLFDERVRHFRAEKQELANRFVPLLLKRCERLITQEKQDVWILIDAGTTLFPFFELIGEETAKLWQKGEKWLEHLHLVTNNLPGIEQLIRTGRRISNERYSELALKECYLLPGIPIPIFAAVAGDLTNNAIKNLPVHKKQSENQRESTFIALVVGNWIRIRNTQPRIPVPMARGDEHREVKQQFIDKADEVYVISPLGKIFVDYSNEQINQALGFKSQTDPGKKPYQEVTIIDTEDVRIVSNRIKLVTTNRNENQLLYRHSCRVEDSLTLKPSELTEDAFAEYDIKNMPHLTFSLLGLPNSRSEQKDIELPHYHTRTNQQVLKMFSIDNK